MNQHLAHIPVVEAYPIDTFFGLAADMMGDLARSGIDPGIIGSQIIAMISLLAQCVDTAWLNDDVLPSGAQVVTVGGSGTGKSAIQRSVFKPVKTELRNFAAKQGGKSPEIFLQDATATAIVEALAECPVATLATAEGGGAKTLLDEGAPTLILAMDGDELNKIRVSTGSVKVCNPRLLLNLLLQPNLFERMTISLGVDAGGIGLINRCHVTAGYRLPPDVDMELFRFSETTAQCFEDRVKALIPLFMQRASDPSYRAPVLRLAPASVERLKRLNKWARSQSGARPGFAEYLSRHAERVLRLAAALHVFEFGPYGQIQEQALMSAEQLDLASIRAFDLLTYPKKTEEEADADTLERELVNLVRNSQQFQFRVSDLRRSATNIWLTKPRFDRALPILAMRGRILIVIQGNVELLHVNLPMQGYLPRY